MARFLSAFFRRFGWFLVIPLATWFGWWEKLRPAAERIWGGAVVMPAWLQTAFWCLVVFGCAVWAHWKIRREWFEVSKQEEQEYRDILFILYPEDRRQELIRQIRAMADAGHVLAEQINFRRLPNPVQAVGAWRDQVDQFIREHLGPSWLEVGPFWTIAAPTYREEEEGGFLERLERPVRRRRAPRHLERQLQIIAWRQGLLNLAEAKFEGRLLLMRSEGVRDPL